MGEIRYIIIAKQCEVAGTSSILDGLSQKTIFGHPSHIDDVPCNLTQFCYICDPLCEKQPYSRGGGYISIYISIYLYISIYIYIYIYIYTYI